MYHVPLFFFFNSFCFFLLSISDGIKKQNKIRITFFFYYFYFWYLTVNSNSVWKFTDWNCFALVRERERERSSNSLIHRGIRQIANRHELFVIKKKRKSFYQKHWCEFYYLAKQFCDLVAVFPGCDPTATRAIQRACSVCRLAISWCVSSSWVAPVGLSLQEFIERLHKHEHSVVHQCSLRLSYKMMCGVRADYTSQYWRKFLSPFFLYPFTIPFSLKK